ncbi:MAG: tetratricopeptide repeat protein [Candidatus Heimdallarchaeota archaeon]|nr:tetratricopeptide repeat protein [Candidatus Heimdallarchaeota archaeon]
MSEERELDELEDLDEEYEDLAKLDEFSLDMEEFDDMDGLEDIPEEAITQSSQKDIIITYGDKIEDEINNLKQEFLEKLDETKSVDSSTTIRLLNDLLNRSKMLEAHSLTAEISSGIANLLTTLKRHGEATEFCLLAVSEARKSGDHELRLRCLTSFGLNLTNFDSKDASVVFSQAIELAIELEDDESKAENSFYFANCQSVTDRELTIPLYIDARKYFETKGKNDWLGKIDYRLGLLQKENHQYQDALNMFNSAKLYLKDLPTIRNEFDIDKKIASTTLLLYSGNTLKYRLRIPIPEIIVQSDLTKKIYELISIRSTYDVIKGLRNHSNVQVSTGEQVFDSLKGILEDSSFERFEDDDLNYTSELYEDIGNLFLKDGKPANAYYYYISAQILYLLIKNSKRAEKNDKKLLKLIHEIADGDATPMYFDLLLYMYYQISYGNISINPKEAIININSGIEIARKRDNPYYEGLFKELLGDIRKEKDLDKAITEYTSAITIYESLEGHLDLMRIHEKLGTEMLSTQTDKAKDILRKALDIAQKIKNEAIVSRINAKM